MWNTSTYGSLQSQDLLHNGGWWHNPDILAATGQGLAKEEARAWEGCWNEKIVELARLTAEDDEALGVLLTGRGDVKFAELIRRMLRSKGLEFDMICLKPAVSPHGTQFDSTLKFKFSLLYDVMTTYTQANDVRMYEDRPKHTKAFRDYFEELKQRLWTESNGTRIPFSAEVVQVTEGDSTMDPITEVAEVQKMVNTHNQAVLDGKVPAGTPPYTLKRNVLFTGYMISASDTQRLKDLVQSSFSLPDHQLKWLGNNIMISPRPASRNIMQKVGGIGAKMRWRIVGRGQYERRAWAIRVEPAIAGAQVYTENRPAYVVVALNQLAKPIEASRINKWLPLSPEEVFEFDSTVQERALLRIDEEQTDDGVADEEDYIPINGVRKHARDEDFPPLGPSRNMPRAQQRNSSSGNNQAWHSNRPGGIGFAAQRGSRSVSRGDRRRGTDRSGRARGGRGAYRSLDASVGQGYNPSAMEY